MAKVYKMSRGPDAPGGVRWKRLKDKDPGPGTWFIDYQDAGGQRVRRSTDAQTKAEAIAVLRARMAENTKADILGVQSTEALGPVAFSEFWTETYLPCSAARVKPTSQLRKEQLGKHLVPYFGSMPLRAINAGRVQEFLTKRAGAGASAGERNRERALLSNIMNEAYRRELVDLNPVSRVRPLKERNTRDLWLRQEDVGALLEAAEPWVKPLVLVAVHTGLRLSELVGLTWDALEHSQGFLRVGAESKGARARFVPVNSTARAALDGLDHYMGPDGAVPWVFFNPHRRMVYRGNSVYHSFKDAAALAAEKLEREGKPEAAHRLRAATFHTTRHTFASWAIQAGISEAEVQQYLGHASPSMTRRYAHLSCPTLRRNALEVLAAPGEVGRFPADTLAHKTRAM